MRGSILGVERRRRWSVEAKLAVVRSVGIDGATVTQVAERHEVTRQQIYSWRRDLKRKGLLAPTADVRFLALGVADSPCSLPEADADAEPEAMPWPVDLLLRNGRCLRFDGAGAFDAAALVRLIRTVEAA